MNALLEEILNQKFEHFSEEEWKRKILSELGKSYTDVLTYNSFFHTSQDIKSKDLIDLVHISLKGNWKKEISAGVVVKSSYENNPIIKKSTPDNTFLNHIVYSTTDLSTISPFVEAVNADYGSNIKVIHIDVNNWHDDVIIENHLGNFSSLSQNKNRTLSLSGTSQKLIDKTLGTKKSNFQNLNLDLRGLKLEEQFYSFYKFLTYLENGNIEIHHLTISTDVTNKLMDDIAKFRAFRFLMNECLNNAEVSIDNTDLLVYTNPSNNSAPYMEVFNITNASIAAITGGATGIVLDVPRTEGDAVFGEVLLNILPVLLEEGKLNSRADPWAGSFTIEHLTATFIQSAWEFLSTH